MLKRPGRREAQETAEGDASESFSNDVGKSQGLVSTSIIGDNRMRAKLKVLYELNQVVKIRDRELDITIVTKAKHLGGMTGSDSKLGPEIRRRQIQTSQASTPLRHSL